MDGRLLEHGVAVRDSIPAAAAAAGRGRPADAPARPGPRLRPRLLGVPRDPLRLAARVLVRLSPGVGVRPGPLLVVALWVRLRRRLLGLPLAPARCPLRPGLLHRWRLHPA